MQKPQALALDKDGVIFDSERLYLLSFQGAMRDLGLQLDPALLHQFAGQSTENLFRMLRPHLQAQGIMEDIFLIYMLANRDALIEQQGMLFNEGAVELITAIRQAGIPLALVTADDAKSTKTDFVLSGRPELMDYFNVIITKDNCENTKPHPEPYQLAAQKLGVSPSALLVVEDSDVGASSALAAGAQTLLLVSDLNGSNTVQTHAKINHLNAVLSYFA
ncbi:MAG: HAD family phosphatase [Cardiobacteriaceae bacterium]|nr:HAD family phosphatase [Cardiobacteriaceae bacterium]